MSVAHMSVTESTYQQPEVYTKPEKQVHPSLQPYYSYGAISAFTEVVVCSILETPVQRSRPGFISLRSFVAYALYRTRLDDCTVHMALILISRLKAKNPRVKGTSTSPHRLFLAASMICAKLVMDDTYSNKSWQIVARSMFDLQEVNQIERELLSFLGWNIHVTESDLADWQHTVLEPYRQDPSSAVACVQRFCADLYLSYRPASEEEESPSSPSSRSGLSTSSSRTSVTSIEDNDFLDSSPEASWRKA